MDVTPRRIEVEIDELVLHGLPAAQRHAIGDAVVRELERLLAVRPVTSDAPSHVDRMDGGSIRTGRNADARTTGRHIARAVFGALGTSRSGGEAIG